MNRSPLDDKPHDSRRKRTYHFDTWMVSDHESAQNRGENAGHRLHAEVIVFTCPINKGHPPRGE